MTEIKSGELIKETTSNKPASSATAFNLAGAVSGFRTFVAGIATTNKGVCFAYGADMSAWQRFIGTVTDAAPDTLSQDVLLESSTGSFIDWSATGEDESPTIEMGPSAARAYLSERVASDYIEGAQLSYDSGDSGINVAAGKATVKGELLEWSSLLSYTPSGLTANNLYNVYLYNNSGTPALEISDTVAVYDADLRAWYKSGDTTRRFIGFGIAQTATTMFQFEVTDTGPNTCEWVYDEPSDQMILVNNVAANSWTQVPLNDYVPDSACAVTLGMAANDAAATAQQMAVHFDNAPDAWFKGYHVFALLFASTSSQELGAGRIPLVTKDVYYHTNSASDQKCYIKMRSVEYSR